MRKVKRTKSGKRVMTEQQEFEIMKLVLDKFLWLGFAIMTYGLWIGAQAVSFTEAVPYLVIGAIVLLIFLVIIVKEYEIIK